MAPHRIAEIDERDPTVPATHGIPKVEIVVLHRFRDAARLQARSILPESTQAGLDLPASLEVEPPSIPSGRRGEMVGQRHGIRDGIRVLESRDASGPHCGLTTRQPPLDLAPGTRHLRDLSRGLEVISWSVLSDRVAEVGGEQPARARSTPSNGGTRSGATRATSSISVASKDCEGAFSLNQAHPRRPAP